MQLADSGGSNVITPGKFWQTHGTRPRRSRAAAGLPQAPGRAAPTPSAPSAQYGELFARRGCDEPRRGARHHARRRGRVLAQADASAGREPGNQNWCRGHAPGPRVGPGSGEAGATAEMLAKAQHAKAHPSPHLQTQSFGSTALHLQDEQRHRGVLKTGCIPFLPGKPAPGRFTGDQLQARLSMNVSQRDVGSCTPVSLGWTKIV